MISKIGFLTLFLVVFCVAEAMSGGEPKYVKKYQSSSSDSGSDSHPESNSASNSESGSKYYSKSNSDSHPKSYSHSEESHSAESHSGSNSGSHQASYSSSGASKEYPKKYYSHSDSGSHQASAPSSASKEYPKKFYSHSDSDSHQDSSSSSSSSAPKKYNKKYYPKSHHHEYEVCVAPCLGAGLIIDKTASANTMSDINSLSPTASGIPPLLGNCPCAHHKNISFLAPQVSAKGSNAYYFNCINTFCACDGDGKCYTVKDVSQMAIYPYCDVNGCKNYLTVVCQTTPPLGSGLYDTTNTATPVIGCPIDPSLEVLGLPGAKFVVVNSVSCDSCDKIKKQKCYGPFKKAT